MSHYGSNFDSFSTTKTQFIWLGSRRRLANVDQCLVAETYPHLVFCDTVCDLGIILDQELNLTAHINRLTRSCYYQLHQVHTVSRSLSHGAAATLVHAFITSRLDHSCSVLVGLPLTLTARLDRVLCSDACLIGVSLNMPLSRVICVTHYIGFPFGSASSTELLCWCGTVFSALPQFTC